MTKPYVTQIFVIFLMNMKQKHFLTKPGMTLVISMGLSSTSSAQFVNPFTGMPQTEIYSFSFESDEDDWPSEWNVDSGDFKWQHHRGSTSTAKTGPPRATDGSGYALVEASNREGKVARMVFRKPIGSLIGNERLLLKFNIHKRDNTKGSAGVFRLKTKKNNQWRQQYQRTGHLSKSWSTCYFDLTEAVGADGILEFELEQRVGTGREFYRSDLAIDHVQLFKVVKYERIYREDFDLSDSGDFYTRTSPSTWFNPRGGGSVPLNSGLFEYTSDNEPGSVDVEYLNNYYYLEEIVDDADHSLVVPDQLTEAQLFRRPLVGLRGSSYGGGAGSYHFGNQWALETQPTPSRYAGPSAGSNDYLRGHSNRYIYVEASQREESAALMRLAVHVGDVSVPVKLKYKLHMRARSCRAANRKWHSIPSEVVGSFMVTLNKWRDYSPEQVLFKSSRHLSKNWIDIEHLINPEQIVDGWLIVYFNRTIGEKFTRPPYENETPCKWKRYFSVDVAIDDIEVYR